MIFYGGRGESLEIVFIKKNRKAFGSVSVLYKQILKMQTCLIKFEAKERYNF